MKRTVIYFSTFAVLLATASVSFAQSNNDAKTVFAKNCALCHGPDGRAQTAIGKSVNAADLTSPAVQNQSDDQIRTVIAKGKEKMAPYGPALGENGLNAMVKYVRTLKAK